VLEALRTYAERPENEPSSLGAVVFELWYVELARQVFAPELGPELFKELLNNSYMLNHALDRLVL